MGRQSSSSPPLSSSPSSCLPCPYHQHNCNQNIIRVIKLTIVTTVLFMFSSSSNNGIYCNAYSTTPSSSFSSSKSQHAPTRTFNFAKQKISISSLRSSVNQNGVPSLPFLSAASLFRKTAAVTTTTSAAPVATTTTTTTTTISKLSKIENTSLFLLSIILVNFIQQFYIALRQQQKAESSNNDKETFENAVTKEESGGSSSGMLDRCPWPFIFFHDVKTGLKDVPTWVVVVFWVFRRVWKWKKSVAV